MLYSQTKKCTLGLDGEPVAPRAIQILRCYQRRALRALTKGEKDFCKLISPVCAKARVRYAKQALVYVTAGISYRLDFLFQDYRIAIEIDGDSHLGELAEAKDEWRDRILADKLGVRTIRFTNHDVAGRYLWVRSETVLALLSAQTGFKKHLREYAATMRDHPDYERQAGASA